MYYHLLRFKMQENFTKILFFFAICIESAVNFETECPKNAGSKPIVVNHQPVIYLVCGRWFVYRLVKSCPGAASNRALV